MMQLQYMHKTKDLEMSTQGNKSFQVPSHGIFQEAFILNKSQLDGITRLLQEMHCNKPMK